MSQRAESQRQQGRNRRRQLIVNKPLQHRIIMSISWPMTLALFLASVVLAYYSIKLGQEALYADAELPSILPMLLITISFMLVSVGCIIFNALKFSHRVAGPMYRLGVTLEAVREGDLHCRAHLRRDDFLHQTADDLNDFLDWLEEHPPQGLESAEPTEEEAPAMAVPCPEQGEEL